MRRMQGARYNTETLQIKYKGKNIADVLNMSVSEALEFFANHERIYTKIKTLEDVGLGYLKLGSLPRRFGRRSAAHQARDGAFEARDRQNAVYSGRADNRPSYRLMWISCFRCFTGWEKIIRLSSSNITLTSSNAPITSLTSARRAAMPADMSLRPERPKRLQE